MRLWIAHERRRAVAVLGAALEGPALGAVAAAGASTAVDARLIAVLDAVTARCGKERGEDASE